VKDQDDARAIESVLDQRPSNHAFDRVAVTAIGEDLDLRLHLIQEDNTVGLRIPGPRSSELQPWIHIEPIDVRDWASMLAIWLDEDLAAGAGHLMSQLRDGIRYLVAAPYGLQRADAEEHQRLLAVAPNGWFRTPSAAPARPARSRSAP
jgi:hypothetical protein